MWSPATGLSNPAIAQPTSAATQNTTYTVTVSDAVGCTNTDQVTVSLFGNTDADAGSDVSICTGDNTQLQASGGVSYLWTPAATLSNPNIANPVATPLVTTTYSVQVTNVDGCIGTATVTVSIADPGITAPADVTSCDGDAVQLVATGSVDYSWSPAAGLSIPISLTQLRLPQALQHTW